MNKSVDDLACELMARMELGESISPGIQKSLQKATDSGSWYVYFRGEQIAGPFDSQEEANRELYREYTSGFGGWLFPYGTSRPDDNGKYSPEDFTISQKSLQKSIQVKRPSMESDFVIFLDQQSQTYRIRMPNGEVSFNFDTYDEAQNAVDRLCSTFTSFDLNPAGRFFEDQYGMKPKCFGKKGFDVESRPDGVVVLLDGVVVAGPFTSEDQVQQAIMEVQSHASTDNFQRKGWIDWTVFLGRAAAAGGLIAGGAGMALSGDYSAGLVSALAGVTTALSNLVDEI